MNCGHDKAVKLLAELEKGFGLIERIKQGQGKLVPIKPPEPESPEEFRLPITKEGQSELITTLKVADIPPL